MDNLKVSVKIMMLVAIAAIGMIILGAKAYTSLSASSEAMEAMYNTECRSISILGQAAEKMRTIQVRSIQAIADPARTEEVKKSQKKDIEEFETLWAEYEELCKDDPADSAKAQEVELLWKEFKSSVPAVIIAAETGGFEAGTAEYNRKAKDDVAKLRDELIVLRDDAIADAAEVEAANEADNASAITTLIVVNVICLIALCVAAMVLIKAIKDPLALMIHICDKLGKGNFIVKTAPSTRADEFGDVHRALYNMTLAVNKFLNEVGHSTEQIAAASQQLTASSMQSANAATTVAQSVADAAEIVIKQQTSVDNGSQAVSNITDSINGISTESASVARNSANAAAKAAEGSRAIDLSVNQIRSVEATVRATADLVDKLGDSSQEIGAIVDTISDLAGQTNLLALNAAIEAARAGEQGRGFAVVAEEVRKLAEQSQTAAQQIAQLISGIQGDTARAVASMDEGRTAVVEGAKSVETLRSVFEEIQSIVDEVSAMVQNMSASVSGVCNDADGINAEMVEIDTGAKRVNDEMQSVSAATEEQSASAQEIASASDALAKLAQEVQILLGKFQF